MSASGTLEAIAVAPGEAPSTTGTATYSIAPVLPAPVMSPSPGSYTTAQAVVLTEAVAGSTIYYTTDGTTPTTSSNIYNSPISVTASETVQAIASEAGYNNSPVAGGTYTVAALLPSPTFSLASGAYSTTQTVTISEAIAGTLIYFTTNGTAPNTSSVLYSGPITVSSSETLQAIAIETGYTNSPIATATYTIGTGTTNYINYSAGGFTTSDLSLNYGTSVTGGMLQLTDGGTGENRSAWFATPVPVNSFITDFSFEQVNASADGMTFAIQGNNVWALGNPGGGLGFQGIPNSIAVKFDLYNNAGEGSDSTGLYIDGSAPTVPAVDLSSTGINLHSGDVMHAHLLYDGTNLTMTLTDTVTNTTVTEVFPVNIPNVIGGNTGYVGFTGGTGGLSATQNVLSWSYLSPAGKFASVPTFSLTAGTYTTPQTITISDATSGVTIYYTTNGTTPTTLSSVYAGPITVSASETIEAIAVKTGYSNSAVATAAYTISAKSTSYISYPSGGFTANNLSLNYGASITTGMLELTDGGTGENRSAWYVAPVPVQSFTTDFTFQQLNATADGMAFVIQGDNIWALGYPGGGLGYAGIANSVAVKFDLYSNAGEGNDSTGLYTGGAEPTVPSIDLSATGINFHSGDVMHVHMVYNGVTLIMTLTDTVTNASVTEAFPVNIPTMVGGNTAYVGFTGGTGASTATQNVLSWTYTSP